MTLNPREALFVILSDEADEDVTADDTPGRPRLAEFWQGELGRDLAAPVMDRIRFDQFVFEVVHMGTDVALRMAQAMLEYTVGGGRAPIEPAPTQYPDPDQEDTP